jgi:hypothetical protein
MLSCGLQSEHFTLTNEVCHGLSRPDGCRGPRHRTLRVLGAEPGQGRNHRRRNGIAVKESDVVTPARGMTMDQVSTKFGAPVSKTPAVGKPPISRWEYPGFVVYFEHEHVIHSVVANS